VFDGGCSFSTPPRDLRRWPDLGCCQQQESSQGKLR
jgi:hypothetical protein